MNEATRHIARASMPAMALWLALVALGCGGDAVEMAPPAQNPDDAMAKWRNMMESPGANLENPELGRLAGRIGQTAPHYVDEMFAHFDDPDLSDDKLLVLVASLEQVVSPDMVPRLVELTQPDKPGHVRGAATYLIGLVQSPEAVAALKALRDDEFGTVRLSALLGLSDRGDESARQALHAIYTKEGTAIAARERILLSAARIPEEADRPIYELGIQSEGFAQETYMMAVSALGRVGTADSIDALNALKGHPDCSVGVRQMCENSIAAIQERTKGSAPTSPS